MQATPTSILVLLYICPVVAAWLYIRLERRYTYYIPDLAGLGAIAAIVAVCAGLCVVAYSAMQP